MSKAFFPPWGLVVGAAALSMWLLGCGGSGSSGPDITAEYVTSATNLKHLDLGLLEYVNDWDEVYPPTGRWMVGLTPYVKNPALFHSPATPDADYGYAFNSALVGATQLSITAPATTIALFDSTDLKYNATDPTSTLPSPPRYGTKNTIAYADGHVAP